MRGLYRVHQFTKVEMFAVTTADVSSVARAYCRTCRFAVIPVLTCLLLLCVRFSRAQKSEEMHQEIVNIEKELFSELGLHFR